MTSRPLDVLDAAKGKKIIVKLKNNNTVSGTLKAFDLHLNMWLEDAELDNKDSRMKFGKLLVRGDNIILVSPE